MTDANPNPASPAIGLAFTSLLRADATVLLRTYRVLVLNIALPLFILFVTFHVAQQFGGAGYLIGLAIAYGLLSSGLLGYSLTVARDREAGVLQRLRVTPTPTWTIMASRLTVQSAANLIIAIIVLLVGSILYQLSLSTAQYAFALLASILGGAVFLTLGQALVGLLKSSSTVSAVGRILYILLILLGLLGTTGILGAAIAAISQWTPLGALMILLSTILGTTAWGIQDLYALIACVGYVIVFAVLGIRWFRWDAR